MPPDDIGTESGAAFDDFRPAPRPSQYNGGVAASGTGLPSLHNAQRRASVGHIEVVSFKNRPLWERVWPSLVIVYMASTYFVSLEAVREAYDLVGLVAALLLGSALQVFLAPVQNLQPWQQSAPSNLEYTGLTSGWVMISCLFIILSVVGILSVVRLIPEEYDSIHLKSFVQRNWMIFSAPVLMLNCAIIMFVGCVLSVAVYIYGYKVAIGGFVWAGVSLIVLMKFQYSLMKRVLKEYPPQTVPTAAGWHQRRSVYLNYTQSLAGSPRGMWGGAPHGGSSVGENRGSREVATHNMRLAEGGGLASARVSGLAPPAARVTPHEREQPRDRETRDRRSSF